MLPSQTNFVFIKLTKGTTLKEFAERMKSANILVGRPFPPATDWCRVSLGTAADMRFFAQTMRQFRAKGWI